MTSRTPTYVDATNNIVREFGGSDTVPTGNLPSNVAYVDAANSWSVAQTPSAAGAKDLGSGALCWRFLYIGGAPTNNQKLTSVTTTAARTFTLPDADSNSVQPATAPSNQFATGISSAGVISFAQVAFSNLSGSATAAQMLALTNTHIYVGNGSNQPADVAMSGDATISSAGALTLKNTGPGANSYTLTALTLDAQGRVTAASNGTAYQTVGQNGTSLTQRSIINFQGSGHYAQDDSANSRTNIVFVSAAELAMLGGGL